MEGIILKGIGGFYTVKADADGALHTLRAQGKLRRQKLKPMVGDRVQFTPSRGEEHGWIEAILPRRNMLVRPPVANVDVIVLTVAAASPEADLLLLDRMLLCARIAGMDAIVVINKADLSPDRADEIAKSYRLAGCLVYPVSAESGEGVPALKQALLGKVHAFAGQSGVGKSTLINALYGLQLVTGSISEKIERGKHTTRHCELIEVEGGGMVLDTPGFSLLELALCDPALIKERYPEFLPYEKDCRFLTCVHITEPGCAVLQAMEDGKIDIGRHERYQILFDEMNQRWRDRYG
ncbi:ribosome small subunit-dependent GTPase A [Eubacteriales bacterium OttesenSCG-928-N13]|nr:ribosome small subunit-dependent GTPase A [Eubacteriales bacterium OttesenSCG-928-N13]